MKKKIEFKANGYLKKTYLDREGAKQVTFEFSAKNAIEIAKLELMSRDLNNHLPILLEIKAEISLMKDYNAKSKHRTQIIR